MTDDRHIIVWRKPETGNLLEWDFHVAESITEAKNIVGNLLNRGVRQYSTFELGNKLPELSSEY